MIYNTKKKLIKILDFAQKERKKPQKKQIKVTTNNQKRGLKRGCKFSQVTDINVLIVNSLLLSS